MKKEVLVVVAHPDDETIWIGGTLLRHSKKDWNVTIISLCRADDRDRAPKFRKVCRILNARSFISGLDDEKLEPISADKIITRIEKFAKKEYDYIFTHGKNGEYGHIRHKEINRALEKMVKLKKISCKKIFFFSYLKKKNNYQGYCIYNSKADNLIKLNNFEFSEKKRLIKNIYGFQHGGFEEKSCRKIESFNEKRI